MLGLFSVFNAHNRMDIYDLCACSNSITILIIVVSIVDLAVLGLVA